MKKLLPCITLLFLLSCSGSQQVIYLSSAGSDDNEGTRKKPFKTLNRVVDEVKKLSSTGKEADIMILIDEGTYRIERTLMIGQECSGTAERAVTFTGMKGKTVQISGGTRVTGWKKADGGLWSARADLPENYDLRELFIDGKRAVRARHPDKDFMRIARTAEDRRTFFYYNENDFPIPQDPAEVELVMLHDWSVTRIKVKETDDSKNIIRAADTIGAKSIDFFKIDNWEKNPRYFLENSMAFLDSSNEYYYDKKKNIIYLKLPDDDTPEDRNIVVPIIEDNLILIKGSNEKRIQNIHFKNISFNVCGWPIPESGYAGIQACHYDRRGSSGDEWNVVPAAVEMTFGENCSFVNCSFRNLGGSGLLLGTGTKSCLVSGCNFEDISGNGIMIGEGNDRRIGGELWWKKAPDEAASGNRIENSEIKDCGKQFFGAVGIWIGLAAKTSILNNHISYLPYTGISVGWLWNPEPTPCRENRIEGNHIHHVMQILSDGGGIYSLGLQPGSSIISNHIHDIPLNAGRAESNGMFLDEGTTDVVISGNIIYRVAKSPLRFHKATSNLVKDNVLACSGDNPPVRYNNTPEEKIKLDNNRVLRESDPEHTGILNKAISSWKNN